MGEETITVDGEEVTLSTEKRFVCEKCELDWLEYEGQCPECQTDKHSHLVAEEIDEWAKIIYDGTSTIEEMAARLERKAKFLRQLKENGWERRGVVDTGHATLRKCE